MSWSLLRIAAGAALVASAAGCSSAEDHAATSDGTSESDVHVAEHVVVADPATAAAAQVEADRVVVPLLGGDGERYRAMIPGTIFAGARGEPDSKNPDGFLRKVTGLTVQGDTLVVATAPAALTDAIVDGAMRASSGGGMLDDHLTSHTLQGIQVHVADEHVFDNVDTIAVNGKKGQFTEWIRLDDAVLSSTPTVEVDLAIRGGKVTRFVAKVEGNLDASIRAAASVSSEGDVDDEVLTVLEQRKHEFRRVLYESKRVPLPTFAVGRVPVSPSVQLVVALQCSVSFGGALYANAGVEAKSYVRLGGIYEDGAWGDPIRSDFDVSPTFSVTRGAKANAHCAITADAELFVYGTSGVAMSVAPYLDFDVVPGKVPDFGAQPFLWTVQAGATGSMRGRDGVFGLSADELQRDLVEWKAAKPLEGTTTP